jgi:iron complex outermembrane receptor protein
MKKLLLLFICSLYTFISFSQDIKKNQLSGKVTDAKTGEPLAGASIVLADSKNGTFSDSAGNYVLENIPLGHTIIEITFSGYKTLVEHIDLHGNDVHDFVLSSTYVMNEGITVTAVAGASSMRKMPIPISRVSKTELLTAASTNIIDALTRQPGINQLSTGPAISKPVIRGLGYNRLVVVNDGIRQEGQQWGDEHGIEIDENSVSRVEIVKGPASLIYGSDAMAGVINIITTSPVPLNSFKGSILSGYQTNNQQRSVFASLGGNHNGFNWNGWGDYKAAGDYRNQYDGRVFNSKFNEHNVGGYVGYNGSWGFSHLIASNFNQKLGVIVGTRNAEGELVKEMPGGYTIVPGENDFNSTDPQVPYQQVRHFKLISDNSFKAGGGKINLSLGWQRNRRVEFGNVDLPSEKSLEFDLSTINYNVLYHLADKNGWTHSIGLGGMRQQNQNKGVEVLIPEYHLFDAGAFLYTQKSIGASTVSGGIRFDNRSLQSMSLEENGVMKFNGFSKSFSNVSGSLGISYEARENLVLKMNLARGFRAPSIPELASNGTHEGTNRYEYGNTNLGSEKSWQCDIGGELNSEHVLFTASAFYNRINNFIFYSKLMGVNGSDSLVEVDGDHIPAYVFNQRNASLFGGELLLDIHPHPLDWFHFENTLSYVRGQFATPVEGVKNVPFIPATKWISEIRAELSKNGKRFKNLNLQFEVDHSFAQNKPFTAFGTETATPAYTLLNASLSTDIMKKNKTLFSLYLTANNISDVAYQSHLSRLKYTDVNEVTGRRGVFNTGRNFMIKLNIPIIF